MLASLTLRSGAGNIDIDLIGDLNITTVLDSYKGDGDSLNFGGGKNSINIGWGDKDDDKAWANEDQIAGLYTDGSASINVDGTTSLTGGAIVADELNLTTGDLEINDLEIYDESKDKEIAIGVNLNNFDKDDKNDSNSYGNVDYKNEGHDKEGEINSTIASNGGTITIGGNKVSKEELEELGVNTDLDNLHIITKDEDWSIDLPVELINAGVAADQVKDVTNAIKSITATVPEQVKAQGPNAEDLYRKGIANGLSGEELEAFANSEKFQSSVEARDAWDTAKEKGISSKDLSAIAADILAGEEIVFLDNGQWGVKKQGCMSGRDPCIELSQDRGANSLSSAEVMDLITKAINGQLEHLEEGTAYDLAIKCAMAWSTVNKDSSVLLKLREQGHISDEQLAKSGFDPQKINSFVKVDQNVNAAISAAEAGLGRPLTAQEKAAITQSVVTGAAQEYQDYIDAMDNPEFRDAADKGVEFFEGLEKHYSSSDDKDKIYDELFNKPIYLTPVPVNDCVSQYSPCLDKNFTSPYKVYGEGTEGIWDDAIVNAQKGVVTGGAQTILGGVTAGGGVLGAFPSGGTTVIAVGSGTAQFFIGVDKLDGSISTWRNGEPREGFLTDGIQAALAAGGASKDNAHNWGKNVVTAIDIGSGVLELGAGGWTLIKNADNIGKLGGKYTISKNKVTSSSGTSIPKDVWDEWTKKSAMNPDSDSLMLGKWNKDGVSYIEEAKKSGNTYFDLGDNWNILKKEHGLTDDDMFDMFNVKVLDDAIKQKKIIKFSHDPRDDLGALGKEWDYLQKNGYTKLQKEGGYWIAK